MNILESIREHFLDPFWGLNEEKKFALYTNKAKLQLKNLKILTTFSIWVVLIFEIYDVPNLMPLFSEFGMIFYLLMVSVVLILLIAIYYLLKGEISIFEETGKINFRSKNIFLYSTIFLGSFISTELNAIDRKYLGLDLIAVIFPLCVFPVVLLLSRKERFTYLLLMFIYISSELIFYWDSKSVRILIENILILFWLEVLFYIIGDFGFSYWQSNGITNLENELHIAELKAKNQEQKNTFNALNLAFDQTYKLSNTNKTELDSTQTIEQKTLILLKDFTETQKLFRSTFQKYQDIFNNVNDGIVILNGAGEILDINRAGLEILEGDFNHLSDLKLKNLVYPEDLEKSQFFMNQLKTEGAYSGYEGRILTPSGKIKYLEVNSTAIYKDGLFAGSRDIIRDITMRKKSEELIEKSRDAEKQFLANMSHEIRTPLNAIIGMAHLMYDTKPTKEQIEYLDILKNSSSFLLLLISNILDMSKIEAGKMELHKAPFDFASLMKTIVQTFEMKVENKPIKVSSKIDPEIDGYLLGDHLILSQILYNLLGNAEKFTEKGEIKLNVSLLSQVQNVCKIEFKISDTGKGIPADKLEIIFNKFTQVHEKDSQKQKGTGLGLALCKQFVEMQGGEIKVESEKDKGTIFTFVLDFMKIETPKMVSKIAESATTISAMNIKNSKILVAEDNPMNRLYLSKLLSKWEVEMTVAEDGKAAVELANAQKFDLILMDIEMPKLNGYEASIAIRNSDNPNKNTPIIALTASAMTTQREKSFSSGMNDFLSKPYTPIQLEESLKKNMPLVEQKIIQKESISSFHFSPIFEQEHLLKMYKGDLNFITQIFKIFITHTLEDLAFKKEIFLKEFKLEEIKQWIHKNKTSFTQIGLSDFTQIMTHLEQDFLDQIKSKEMLQKEFENLCTQIEFIAPLVKEESRKLETFLNQNYTATSPAKAAWLS